MLCALVRIGETCFGNWNICADIIACEHHSEYRFEQISSEIELDTFDIEYVFVHINIDMVEYRAYECQHVNASVAVGRFKRTVLNDKFAVVDERLLDRLRFHAVGKVIARRLRSRIALESVDSALDLVEKLTDEIAEQLIDVDIVNLELRSVRAEQTACVDINAVQTALVKRTEAFSVVSAENSDRKFGIFGVSCVDFTLESDCELNRSACKVDFFCKQRLKRRKQFGVEILFEEI